MIVYHYKHQEDTQPELLPAVLAYNSRLLRLYYLHTLAPVTLVTRVAR